MDMMLTFPIFAFLLLFFIQMALVLHAYTIIQYSAYTAARAARVQIFDGDHAFRDLDLGLITKLFAHAPNLIKIGGAVFDVEITGMPEVRQRIHAAAMNQLVTISPASNVYATGNTGDNWDQATYTQFANAATDGYGSNRVSPLIRKAKYAYDPANTEVEISIPELSELIRIANSPSVLNRSNILKLADTAKTYRNVAPYVATTPHYNVTNLPISVTVKYRYELQIPIGRTFFANDDERPYGRWMSATVNLM